MMSLLSAFQSPPAAAAAAASQHGHISERSIDVSTVERVSMNDEFIRLTHFPSKRRVNK